MPRNCRTTSSFSCAVTRSSSRSGHSTGDVRRPHTQAACHANGSQIDLPAIARAAPPPSRQGTPDGGEAPAPPRPANAANSKSRKSAGLPIVVGAVALLVGIAAGVYGNMTSSNRSSDAEYARLKSAAEAAETKADTAAAALARSEDARKAAEARVATQSAAERASTDLAKSEDARKAAEASDTAAAALAKSDNLRRAAETKADAAAQALATAKAASVAAETRATAAESARKDADARLAIANTALAASLAALRAAETRAPPVSAAPAPGFTPLPRRRIPPLLSDMGSPSLWARGSPSNCGDSGQTYYFVHDGNSITWLKGQDVDIETVVSDPPPGSFSTTARSSQHADGKN